MAFPKTKLSINNAEIPFQHKLTDSWSVHELDPHCGVEWHHPQLHQHRGTPLGSSDVWSSQVTIQHLSLRLPYISVKKEVEHWHKSQKTKQAGAEF